MKGTGNLFSHCKRIVLSILIGCMFCAGSPTAKAQVNIDPVNAGLNATQVVRLILQYIEKALGITNEVAGLTDQLKAAAQIYEKFEKYAEWAKKATQTVNTAVTNYRALQELYYNYELLKGDWERTRANYEFYANAHLDIDPRNSTITLGNAIPTAKYTFDLITDMVADAATELEFIKNVVGVGSNGKAIWEMKAEERLALVRETNWKLRQGHETFIYIAGLLRAQEEKKGLNVAVQKGIANAFGGSSDSGKTTEEEKEREKEGNDIIEDIAEKLSEGSGSSSSSVTSTGSGKYSPSSSTLQSVEKMFTDKGTIDNVFSIVLYGILGLAALLAPLAYMRVVKGEVQHRDAMFNLMAGLVAMILIVQVVRLVLFGS